MKTLAGPADKAWPIRYWPRMKLESGLRVGSKGGHGPIAYTITDYNPNEGIRFEFQRPKGFHGHHELRWSGNDANHTELSHLIEMRTNGWSTLTWSLVIRWLHDALIENAFDRVEESLNGKKVFTKWTLWVRFLRKILK